MKRYLKSLFKVSMAFITIGTIAMMVGLLMGGAGELSREVTELVHVVRKGVSETVARIPLLESITNINGFTLVVDKDEVSVEVNEQYETIQGDYSNLQLADVSEVQNLNVGILSGNCRILPSENGSFGVSSSNAGDYQCYVENGTLYLNAFLSGLDKTEENAEIILYIPQDAVLDKVFMFCSGEGLSVETVLSGTELNISSICGINSFEGNLEFENAVITVGVGEFVMQGLTAKDVKLEVSTAQATVEDLIAEDLSLNLGMGSLKITGDISDDIVLNCGMGSLEMVLAAQQDAYNYDISGSAESVQIGTDTLAGMVMERWIDNSSERQITLSCAMGSVKIEFAKQN